MSLVNSIDIKDWNQGVQEAIRLLDRSHVETILSTYVDSLLPLIREHTPISPDEEHEAGYVHAVDMWEATVNGSSINITNDKVYAKHLEIGSVPGEKPWPTTGGSEYETKDRKTGKVRKRLTPVTGRTIMAKDRSNTLSGHAPGADRIWAGKLNPGAGRSIGGAISRAHIDLKDKAGIWPDVAIGGISPPGKREDYIGDDLGDVVKTNIFVRVAGALLGGAKSVAKDVVAAGSALARGTAGDAAAMARGIAHLAKRILGG